MLEVVREFEFARTRLVVDCTRIPLLAGDTIRVCPALPEGMRVERCLLDTVEVELGPQDEMTISLDVTSAKGWEVSWESGEALDAFVFYHRSGDTGAFGMRAPEWLSDRYGLVHRDANRPVDRSNSLTATYRALRGTKVAIQAAFAWTNHPKTDQEAMSPWYAVDLAMSF